jgi:prephenate dehydrogenase
MIVTVVGLGLIGGSIAYDLKAGGFCSRIIGVDTKKINAEEALKLKIVDELGSLEAAVRKSHLIIIAVPVDSAVEILPQILDLISSQVVIDVGSTKVSIIEAASRKTNRGRYVASHPIWGTENSGPQAASRSKLNGHITVICDPQDSDRDALALAESMYNCLGMKMVFMNAREHDLHAAYISHISHITSFSLALSVLAKEKETETIFQLAGSGFESTVRLAKSSPDMWTPIIKQNRINILDVLNEQINQLNLFKELIQSEDYERIHCLIRQSNEIRKIFNK